MRDGEGLYDVIDGPDGDDASIRPNQIFAVSLPHSPLSADDQARVVRVCRRHLLTSYGLRSLAPGSPAYHPRYDGGVRERDGGYHQGPVWGWLLGPFQPRRLSRRRGDAAGGDRRCSLPMSDALEDQGLGTIGEIFDGDPRTIRAAPRRRPGRSPARSTPGAHAEQAATDDADSDQDERRRGCRHHAASN